MANNVFANGREISCKSAAGKSIAAFPDVCFTPPESPPPGIPIPYPNTGFARDTTAGSKTVKITGKEVMLKNKSYFKKSTGDEAGCAAKKGILTSVNTGKVYFTVWSMNVKVEGENVVRHFDLTTHNHNSQPGNTPPWLYVDTPAVSQACKQDRDKANKACKPTAAQEKDFKDDQDRANRRRKKKGKRPEAVRSMGWKDAHCTGIMRIKPFNDLKSIEKAVEGQIEQIKESIANLEDMILDRAKEIAASKAEKVAVRAGAKYLGSLFGGPLAPVLAAVSTVVTVVDGAYSTMTGAMEAYAAYSDISSKIGDLEGVFAKANEQLADAKRGTELLDKASQGKLTPAEQKELDALTAKAKEMGRKAADAQDLQAKADPCLRALKCRLAPYTESHDMETNGKPETKGCCPGQTGHHIPPQAYFKNCKPTYNYRSALVVCVEGINQYSGSHGRLHDQQDSAAAKLIDADGNLSYDDAIEASVEAHKEAFPLSGCNAACIREQLKASLDKCKNSKINPVNKGGGSLSKPPKREASF